MSRTHGGHTIAVKRPKIARTREEQVPGATRLANTRRQLRDARTLRQRRSTLGARLLAIDKGGGGAPRFATDPPDGALASSCYFQRAWGEGATEHSAIAFSL